MDYDIMKMQNFTYLAPRFLCDLT